MARYGQYETESRIAESDGIATYAVRGDSEADKSKVIKAWEIRVSGAESEGLKKAAGGKVCAAAKDCSR